MGRYYWSKKEEADSLKKIEIWWLKRNGYLQPGCWQSGGIKWTHGWSDKESSVSFQTSTVPDNLYIRLIYTQTNQDRDKKDFDYKAGITTTPCHYGGVRYWFICPLTVNGVYCGRRVGTLYKAGDYFGCRNCQRLTYDSRNETRSGKHYPLFYVLNGYQKANKLEEKIKRRYYNGKPTRKQRRLDNIYARMFPYASAIQQMEKDKAA